MDNVGDLPFEIPPPRNRACDMCFAKKIKCDREDPCKHCVATQAVCIRQRPKRRGNPDYERRKIAAAVRHASQFANASPAGPSGFDRKMDVDYHFGGKPPATDTPLGQRERDLGQSSASQSRFLSPSPADSPSVPPRRASVPVRRQGAFTTLRRPDVTSGSAVHANMEAQCYFQSFLSREGMDVGRREVLQSALTLVNQPNQGSDPDADAYEDSENEDFCPYPSAEMLHSIVHGPARQQSIGLSYVLDMVSKETIEKQGLALLDGNVRAPARHHYSVNIGYSAWVVTLASVQSTPKGPMRDHLVQRLQQYETVLLKSVHHIGVLDPPSLTLLQALLSGTLFMIHTGRLEKCYQLSCAASRVLVALGGRSYSSFINTLKKEDVVGAKFCLTLCILYDKSLSLAMNRPSCLPDINLDASVITPLDPNRPFTAIAHIYLELALVQDGIIRGQTGMTEPRDMLDLVKTLQQKMWHIREKIRQGQARHPLSEDAYLYGEYIGTDFTYHSIMTSIIRLHPNLSDDPNVLEQMLGYARTALSLLTEIINHGASLTNMHTLTISIVWMLLCYPLFPFFIIFCNVINVSDRSDYELLSQVTESLILFEQTEKAVTGLRRLFEKFLQLCKPLIDKQQQQQQQQQLKVESPQTTDQNLNDVPRQVNDVNGGDKNMGVPAANMFRKPPMSSVLDPSTLMVSMGQAMQQYPNEQMGPMMGQVYDTMSHINSLGEEDLLMHLGNTQPSLEWIDSAWPS